MRKYLMAAMLLVVALPVSAQDYPNRPVRLVNPGPPGGSTDPIARLIAQKLTEAWGQPVVVETRPGAATNLANELVAKSTPDGYTLLNAVNSIAINPALYPKISYDPVKDFSPIVLLVQSPNMLAVHASLPVQSVSELIAHARANPGKLSYGSSGNGATNHLAMELFKNMAKVDMIHIPYKGGAAAVNDLLGGRIEVMFNPPAALLPHAKTGKIRVLAVTSAERLPGVDLPTIAEAGLPGFESSVWYGLFSAAGTPRPIVDKINKEVNRILKDKTVSDQFLQMGLVTLGGTSDELAEYVKQEVARWAKVVKESGAKVD